MLYCQPQSFYEEMKFLSDNIEDFPKKLLPGNYQIPENLGYIEPVSFLIKMFKSSHELVQANTKYAVRTFGARNSLTPYKNCGFMSVTFAMKFTQSLYISASQTVHCKMVNGELRYWKFADDGMPLELTIEEIAHAPAIVDAYHWYINFDAQMFNSTSIVAKIPLSIIKILV